MDDGLVKIDALVHNCNIFKLFEVNGPDRLDKNFHFLLSFFIFLGLSLRLFLNFYQLVLLLLN